MMLRRTIVKVNHICFIVEGYPTSKQPGFTFVRELVASIADKGIKCSVIVPQSITKTIVRKRDRRPSHWIDTTENNNQIDVYQPTFISFSNYKINNYSITYEFWKRSIIKTFKKEKIDADVLYGHFWHSGHVGSIIGKEKNIPVFVATGEDTIRVYDIFKKSAVQKHLPFIKGVVSVSTENMEQSVALDLTTRDKVKVIPNAIDAKKFHQKDKSAIRRQLGFAEDDFIVAFTGSFDERKGVLRLAEAVKQVGDVKTIFIGSGELQPDIDGILFSGRLPHKDIPDYLNAADVFVLPTLSEGCSNAIVEAMGCGLPIISSELAFNDDILTEENSIRVNSQDVEAIAGAIRELKNNPTKRKELAKASLESAKTLNIEVRGQRVLDYIKKNR